MSGNTFERCRAYNNPGFGFLIEYRVKRCRSYTVRPPWKANKHRYGR